MKHFKIFLLLLLTPGGAAIYAQLQGQARIDSMLKELPKQKEDTNKVKLLNRLSYGYNMIKPDEGIKYGQLGLELARRLSWQDGIAWADNCLAWNYYYKSDYAKALEYDFKSLKISEGSKDKAGIAMATNAIAAIYYQQSDYKQSLKYFSKTLAIYEEVGDKWNAAKITLNMGSISGQQGDNAKALEYYFKALKMNEEIGNKPAIAVVNGNIGAIYTKLENYQMALPYLDKALKMAEEQGQKHTIAKNLGNLGTVYKFLAISGLPVGKYRTWQMNKAIDYLQRSLAISKELELMDIVQNSYEKLSEVYTICGDFERSLDCYKKYIALRDTIFSKENENAIVQQSMKYEFEKTRIADSLKAHEKDNINRLKLQRQKSYTYLGIAGILLLACFSFFIVKERGKSEQERKKSDNLLLNILPAEVANELKASGTTTARHYDSVTVLFTDFVNFTNAGERMSPQGLIDELHACFKKFDEITHKYNIEKIKTIGDAYLAVCGLPSADPKHAENVVRAAAEINAFMQDRVAKLGERTFQVRIGIHSGSVVAGIVGVKKFAYDIWGDTVNTAARMEQNSVAGRINISQATYELIKDKFACEYRGEIEAKGKGVMKMYFVV